MGMRSVIQIAGTQRNATQPHCSTHLQQQQQLHSLETEGKTEGTDWKLEVETLKVLAAAPAGSKAGRFNLKMETPWNKVGFLEEPAS
jgi:hypothetical protein